MEKKNTNVALILVVVFILVLGSCAAGFFAGRVSAANTASSFLIMPGQTPQTLESQSQIGSSQDIEQLFSPFWQAWKLVHQEYVDQPVNDTLLMRGAIKGMIDALGDEHSSYIDPDLQKEFNAQLSGEEYEGIGAYVDTTREYLTIIAPMMDSPAEKAGLKAGDMIIAIDGQDMTGINGELARQKVLGPAGSQVRLTVKRAGVDKPFDVMVTRASIKSSNVIGRMEKNNIAYIRLLAFGDEKTTQDFHNMLQKLLDQKPKGIILDLRNNGGGLLNSAIDISSEFIKEGVIVYEQYGDGHKDTYKATGKGIATDIPLIVLVNEGSASASEIVAGAIQDLGRGKLVGVTTYGKGSVQIWTDLVDNQGAVRITVARWLTPNGKTIHKIGLTPDIAVTISDADISANRDPQLEKAIELLSQ